MPDCPSIFSVQIIGLLSFKIHGIFCRRVSSVLDIKSGKARDAFLFERETRSLNQPQRINHLGYFGGLYGVSVGASSIVFSYCLIPIISLTSCSSPYSPSGRILRGKHMPCDITPAIFIVRIRNPLERKNSNSGFSGNTESISMYTHLSPQENSPFFTITCHPSMMASSMRSRPSMGIKLLTSFMLASFRIKVLLSSSQGDQRRLLSASSNSVVPHQ